MVKVEKVSKRALAVEVMKANATKSMAEVVVMIADRINVTESNAKSYYRYIVEHKLAEGNVAKTAKVKVAKPEKQKTVKLSAIVKQVSKKFAEDRKAPSKSDDEIAKIKAANLQRMKDVSLGRKHYNNVAGPAGPGVENFDPVKAKAQVAAFMNGDDDAMNDSPRFLSKAELNVIL